MWKRNLVFSLGAVLLLVPAIILLPSTSSSSTHDVPSSRIVIDARIAPEPPQAFPFPVGGQSPEGHVLAANSRYLMLDGKPWFPIMGEFHFSRYPEAYWEKEILKMKANGIQVISTYVFWIHHEEVEGQFDWTGQRDLRRFIDLCAKHGLYVWVRVGPWAHGETRNGGLPDWLVAKCATRQNDPVYLSQVRRFYEEIGKQVKGRLWKDGGPIIGFQIENEYGATGPGKGTEHMLTLLNLAREAGLDAPFYTATGWDGAQIPSRDMLPVFSGYADGFWSRSLVNLPPSPNYFFTTIRCEENVESDLHSRRPDIDTKDSSYPFLTAEMGAGMELAYHRRPRLSADDTAAMELVKLGSGVTMYGYYMFHGGTNPDGKKSTLQESQATGYPNDLPVKSYDFQAPLGEFGQTNPSYRALKTFHLFLEDFGSGLARMTTYFPEQMPESKQDIATPRLAARLEGDHGFIFLNNYQRTYPLPERKDFQVRLQLPSGVMEIPRRPVEIPSGAYTIWPLNLDMGGSVLRYATAQLLGKLDDPRTFVFFIWPGIPAEFAFQESSGVSIEAPQARVTREAGIVYIDEIQLDTQAAIRLHEQSGSSVQIVVLSREQALNTWKANLGGRERLILSRNDLYFDQNNVHVVSDTASKLSAGFFPPLARVPSGFADDGNDGIFHMYTASVPKVEASAKIEQRRDASACEPVRLGKEVALAPDETAFDCAARWTISVPAMRSSTVSNVFLRILYEGDVARLYAGGKLLTDNFYNGSPWEIGLERIPAQELSGLELRILPLQEHAPIYLPDGVRPAFPPSGQIARLKEVQIVTEYELVMDLTP